MTDPTPPDDAERLEATDADHLIESTGNGPQPDDPAEQPSQKPDDLPPGTVSGHK